MLCDLLCQLGKILGYGCLAAPEYHVAYTYTYTTVKCVSVTTAGDSRGTHLTAYAGTGSTLRSWLRPRPRGC